MAFIKRPGFEREPATPSSFTLELAEKEILSTYGDSVSVIEKAKTLLKFGKNLQLSNGTRETVWTTGGHETYVSSNSIDTISSSDAGDNQEIYLECHTVTGTGANQQFTFLTQTVTLNGQNKVTLPTPVARVSRAQVNGSSAPAGDISVYEDTALTGGVPTDTTKIHISILGSSGEVKAFKAATTFSNLDYFICTGGLASIRKRTATSVDFVLEVRTPGGLFLPASEVSLESTGSGFADIRFDPFVIIPKNSDLRITAESSTNNTEVSASFQGYLAKVIA